MKRLFLKALKYTLIISIVFGIAGFVLFLIAQTGIFDAEVITRKYCYILNSDNNQLERIYLSYKKETGYKYLDYYTGKYKNKPFVMDVGKRIAIPYDMKVDVIGFTEDSLLAKVKAEWEVDYTPFLYEIKGYVPSFTLYDTLPEIANN